MTELHKTHWKKLVNPNYIGAYALEDGKDLTVIIEKVQREQVTGDGGKIEECTVAYLKGHKPLILNRTNAKTITRMYNSPYIEDWVGKKITLYPTTTKVAGEMVECLRIRPMIPKEDDYEKEINTEIQRMKACKSLAELQNVYSNSLYRGDLKIIAEKDKLKNILK